MQTPGWGRPSCTSTTPTPRGVPDARGTVPSAGPHSLHQAQPSTRQRTPALAVLSRPGGQQGAPEPPWRSDPAQAGEEGAASPEEDGAAGRGGAGTATALSDPGLWAGPGGQRPGRPRGRQSFTRRSRTVPGQPGPSSEGRKSPPVHTAGPCWLQTPVPSQTPAPGGGLTRGVHLAEQPPAFGVEGHARTPLELLGRLGGWKTRAVSALPRRRL